MMGEKPLPNTVLRQVMHLIDSHYWKRARSLLEDERRHTAVDLGRQFGNEFVALKRSPHYRYTSALIWLLQNDDRSWLAERKRARATRGWTPELAADTLYDHATLLIRNKWRNDKVEGFLQEVLDLSKSKKEEDEIRRVRTLTTWGKFLRGQKKYDEARLKLTKALDEWTAIKNEAARILTHDQKRWMAETNWLLLKTLVKLRIRADQEEIDHLASWAIWHDPNWRHKFAAAKLRIGRRKTIDE